MRLVKLIGDAVMLVAPEPAPMLDKHAALVEAAEDQDFPPLRAGRGLRAGRAPLGRLVGRPRISPAG